MVCQRGGICPALAGLSMRREPRLPSAPLVAQEPRASLPDSALVHWPQLWGLWFAQLLLAKKETRTVPSLQRSCHQINPLRDPVDWPVLLSEYSSFLERTRPTWWARLRLNKTAFPKEEANRQHPSAGSMAGLWLMRSLSLPPRHPACLWEPGKLSQRTV